MTLLPRQTQVTHCRQQSRRTMWLRRTASPATNQRRAGHKPLRHRVRGPTAGPRGSWALFLHKQLCQRATHLRRRPRRPRAWGLPVTCDRLEAPSHSQSRTTRARGQRTEAGTLRTVKFREVSSAGQSRPRVRKSAHPAKLPESFLIMMLPKRRQKVRTLSSMNMLRPPKAGPIRLWTPEGLPARKSPSSVQHQSRRRRRAFRPAGMPRSMSAGRSGLRAAKSVRPVPNPKTFQSARWRRRCPSRRRDA